MKVAPTASGVIVAGLLVLAACGPPSSPPANPPTGGMVMTTTIQIINSGATDSIGYRVLIGTGGDTSYVSGDGSGNALLPAELFQQIKRDISDAKPLAALPLPASCIKPMSFGTSTFVAIGGDRSPDLTCPANDAAKNLKEGVAAIVAFLKIRNVPRGAGKDLPPQNF